MIDGTAIEKLRDWAAESVVSLLDEGTDPEVFKRGVAFIAAPKDVQITTLETEKYLTNPLRAKGRVVLRNAESFIAYVNAHKEPETAIFAETTGITAVFNHHGAAPGWGDYRAELELHYTPAWSGWHGLQNELMEQQVFAEFLEENLLDVIEPDGATLLEMVGTLKATMSVVYEKAVNLANGQVQMQYREVLDGTAGQKGEFKIPERFKLALRCFEGGDVFEVPALLKWRLANGHVKFMWKLAAEATKVFEASFEAMAEGIAKGTELPVYRGRI